MNLKTINRGIFACGFVSSLFAFATGTSSGAGCGNPAAIYCDQLGGLSVTVLDAQQNELGLCHLQEDSVINEWTLFSHTNMASQAFLKVIPDFSHFLNPSQAESWETSSCESQGGKIVLYSEPYRPTLKWAMCHFSDKSEIEARTFAYGPGYYPVLKKTLEEPVSFNSSCH